MVLNDSLSAMQWLTCGRRVQVKWVGGRRRCIVPALVPVELLGRLRGHGFPSNTSELQGTSIGYGKGWVLRAWPRMLS